MSFCFLSRLGRPPLLAGLLGALASCQAAPAEQPAGQPPVAQAVPPRPRATYPFPTKMPYSSAQISQLFGIVYDRNDPDPALHYQVMMPKTWAQVTLPPRQRVSPQHPVQQQCLLKSTQGPLAEIKVTLVYVPEEVAPDDWLTNQLAVRGEKVLQAQSYPQAGGRQPDVLTISTTPGPERISRWVVLKDGAPATGGAHFFVLQASTLATNYAAELADVFLMAVNNFDILHSTHWDYAEQLRTLVRVVPTKVATVFPLSWQQRENPRSDEHFYQVKLTKDLDGRRIGQVNLMLTAGQSEAEMRRLEEENRQGYQQADHLTFAPAHFEPAPKFGTFDQVFTALTPQTDVPAGTPAQERQVLLARAGTYWVLLENTRFTQQASPEAWAISKRGFEIVQEHLVVKP